MNHRATVHFNKKHFFAFILIILLGVSVIFSSRADIQVPQAQQTIDLTATPANVSILGANDEDHLGGNGTDNVFTPLPRSHALVTGDFNADGILDIAVGAPDADYTPLGSQTNRSNTGAVYILFGRQTFPAQTIIDANIAASSQPDVRIYGAADNDRTGFALAVGDINADGVTDLLVGAPGVDFGTPTARTDTGAVFIFLGSSTLTPRTIDLAQANAANIAIYGEKAGDGFGSSLAVGDAGGSSTTADILVGAPTSKGANGDRTDGGAAYLLYGSSAFTPNPITQTRVVDLATIPANVRVFGVAGSSLGSAVAIGDVNGTAPGELLIGAPHADRPATVNVTDTGAVFGILGGANLVPATGSTKNFDIAATEQNISIYGINSGDHVGASVATGDVTGDGIADLVIGAPDADGPSDSRQDSGEAYLISGGAPLTPPPGGELRITVFTVNVNLTVYGESVGAHLGAYVTTGRLNTQGNQDGIAEMIVGSPGALSNRGTVSVFYGGASLTFINVRDVGLGQDDFRVLGQTASELGWSIVATDLDNNRGGDLVLGAPFANHSNPLRTKAGRVYVLLAASDVIPPVNQAPVVQVTAPNGGESIAGGSTVNITWTASDPNGDDTIQSFEIRLSTDGGTTFNTIITSGLAGNVRTFAWNVNTGLTTPQARIRVIATDNTNLQGQDDSNANFTITDVGVAVTLTAPNGGERLRFGQVFQITWTVPVAVEAQVQGFDLFLSTDGGATFTIPIKANLIPPPALGAGIRTFDWTVPSTCLGAAKVLVVATSVTGARSSDASDANFSVVDIGPTIDLNSMFLDETFTRLTLRTTTPAVGNEVPIAEGAVISISNDEAGTAFSSFKKFKSKRSGTKIITKGSINEQELGTFFPNNAVRFLRITNPTCGETLLKVKRQNDQLVVVTTGTVEEPQD